MEDFICESCVLDSSSEENAKEVETQDINGIVLYTTHCPKCTVLERKLNEKGVNYSINEDVDEMIRRGFQSAPVLSVNGDMLDFSKALRWIEGYK